VVALLGAALGAVRPAQVRAAPVVYVCELLGGWVGWGASGGCPGCGTACPGEGSAGVAENLDGLHVGWLRGAELCAAPCTQGNTPGPSLPPPLPPPPPFTQVHAVSGQRRGHTSSVEYELLLL
jgi:hypothetical protein